MPSVQYGQSSIEWCFQPDAKLKRHYVTVERGQPVLLRGPQIDLDEQRALVLHRARWIRAKQALVELPYTEEAIVTGSRLRYCGRSYFTEVKLNPALTHPTLTFTASRFVIESPSGRSIESEVLSPLLAAFYGERAHERLLPRVRHWERATGLQALGARIRHFQSRWASCNAQNILEFHPRVMELPASVQDYVVVHELCHTVEKSHTRAFWALVARQMPDWRRQHEMLERAALGDSL